MLRIVKSPLTLRSWYKLTIKIHANIYFNLRTWTNELACQTVTEAGIAQIGFVGKTTLQYTDFVVKMCSRVFELAHEDFIKVRN